MRREYLKIAGLMVLMLVLLGWWGYNSFFESDPEIAQQLNNQFGTEFFNSFTEEPSVVDAPITGAVLDKIEANIPSAQGTEEAIIQKYAPQFQSLENVVSSRMDALSTAALQEYRQQEKDGTLNLPVLARKYIQAGNILEANVDSQFNITLNAMQDELAANNQSTDVIADIKQEYAAAKSKESAQLLSIIRP